MDVSRARAEVAQAARILHHLGYLDLMGHVSLRLADTALVITPGYGPDTPPPARMRPEDIAVVDRDGRKLDGAHPPHIELPLHLAVYDRSPSVGAIVCASPPTVMAFGIVGRPVLPLTHSQAWLAHQGAPSLATQGLMTPPERAADPAQALAEHPICHLRGVGTVFVADTLIEAMRSCDTYEYLAKIDVLTRSLTDSPRTVSRAEAESIRGERSGGETIPSRDPARYYASFDEPEGPARPTFEDRHVVSDDEIRRLKVKIAASCRMLATRQTLVGFFEHVSHRAPDEDRFLMSPAKRFDLMDPQDVGVIGMEGDCAWLEGPYPPAPFRRFHRDLLRARPDVQGIVHTHEMYGRAFAMSERPLEPVFRNGAHFARPIPTVDRPTMIFSEEDRNRTIATVSDDVVVHTLAHGTDYLAASLEEATVAAIHREQAYATLHLALRLGEPAHLAPELIDELERLGPSADDWWRYYGALL